MRSAILKLNEFRNTYLYMNIHGTGEMSYEIDISTGSTLLHTYYRLYNTQVTIIYTYNIYIYTIHTIITTILYLLYIISFHFSK